MIFKNKICSLQFLPSKVTYSKNMFHCPIGGSLSGILHILIKKTPGIYVNKIARLVG